MQLRKTLISFLIIAISVQFAAFDSLAAAGQAPPVTGASGIVIEASTEKVLWSSNADERRAMASTTKMMTALIVTEKLNLNDTVKVGRAVLGVDGSGLGISAGEELVVRELLYSMMLKSANDAANALAEKVAGSVPAFVKLMNEKAVDLGLKNTHFMNAHGLDQPGHYSSARELAVIARELLKQPAMREIVKTKSWSFKRRGRPETLKNRNMLLESYRYATGVKTGHTESAGYCLVSSATKDGNSLIAVVLGAPSEEAAADISRQALEYGFSLYSMKLLVKKGKIFREVELPDGRRVGLVAAGNLSAFVREGGDLKMEAKIDGPLKLPVSAGKKYGRVALTEDGKALGEVALVADRDVEPITCYEWVVARLRSLLSAARLTFLRS